MSRAVGITGLGVALPERVLTNKDLEKMVETSDEWITQRTGIRERRVADDYTAASDLGTVAARRALAVAGLDPADVELIVVATVTPDMMFPATACLVQANLGAVKAAAFDLEAGCTGFIYALAVGSQFVASGVYDNVLIIGAETLSKIVDWTDRGTCVLLGDGAGAAVLQPARAGEGILSFYLGADGNGGDLLKLPAGGSRIPITHQAIDDRLHYLKMNGNEVYKFAVKTMGEAAQQALEKCGLGKEDIDVLVPHQANMRIIRSAAKRFGLPPEKVITNLDRYGNMSAASIPVALEEAVKDGRINPGDIVLLVGFGAGLTWGASVVRWGELTL